MDKKHQAIATLKEKPAAEAKDNRSGQMSADRPILGSKQDWLRRTPFAEALGDAILGWNEADSLVIGLYGDWGSGKSSVVNLCLEYLRRNPASCPHVIEFNPWHFPSEEELHNSFFNELQILVTAESSEEVRKCRSTTLLNYSAAIRALTPVSIALLVAFFPQIKAGLDVAKELAAGGETGFDRLAKLADKPTSLQAAKKAVAEILAKLDKPILVVIDDIDRLRPAEIRSLVQLVKANADFPKLIYLLCFQRNIVENALENPGVISGQDFLEKIIQVGFDLPVLESELLCEALESALMNALSETRLLSSFDQQRWSKMFEIYRSRFKTARHLRRFLNSFRFQLALFKGDNALEVDPVDLVCIEILRVFEPTLHKRMFESKDRLVGISAMMELFDKEKKQAERRARFEEMLQGCQDSPNALELLKALFPAVARAYSSTSSPHSNVGEAELLGSRVCHELIFSRYFLLTVPRKDISNGEFEKLLDAIVSSKNVAAKLSIIQSKGLLLPTLERLTASQKRIPVEAAPAYISALLNLIDTTNDEVVRLPALVLNSYLLTVVPDIIARFKILKLAIENCSEILVLVHVVRILILTNKDTQRRLVRSEDLPKLCRIASRRLAVAANSGKLEQVPQRFLASVLYWWSRCGSPSAARKWVSQHTRTSDSFIYLIQSLLQIEEAAQTDDAVIEDASYGDLLLDFELASDLGYIKEWIELLMTTSIVQKKLHAALKQREQTNTQRDALAKLKRLLERFDQDDRNKSAEA